jgi:putative ABC transport system substrate-binding protein
MRRRKFIALLGGAAVALPFMARAQQATIPLIGFLGTASPGPYASRVAAFRRGLNELGYVEGRNVAIEFRWAEEQYDQLPALAADLIHRKVAVIATAGGPAPARAAEAATASIPIVFSVGEDPVKSGLVTSLNKPGGNKTGVFLFGAVMGSKRLSLVHELVPNAPLIALLVNPNSRNNDTQSYVKEMEAASHSIGLQLLIVNATAEPGLGTAFATLAQQRVGALLIAHDAFFIDRRVELVVLAAQQAMPAIYSQREFVEAGGLMSYGTSSTEEYRQAGVYVGRVLKGEKPADLPVMQSSKFELIINMKTAKTLGLTIPPGVLAIADEVIE